MVAKKLDINTLYTGKYIVQEGFNPNYIEVNGERVSRARVLATVIDKFISEDGNYGTITLDDGTDTIRVKAFQDLRIIEDVEKGDIVEVIGKIREYNEERYLQPEIIVKVDDPNFEVLRKLELRKIKASAPSAEEAAEVKIETAEEIKNLKREEKKPEEAQEEKVEKQKEDSSKGNDTPPQAISGTVAEQQAEKKGTKAKKGPAEQKKLV